MEECKTKSKASDYREITVLYENEKSEVVLAKSKIDKRIYVKKTLSVYNKEVYEKIKELNSRNLPRIYEIFEEDEFLIVIEEFLNGDNLGNKIKEKLFSEKEALSYMLELCNAVEKLHNLDIIHRDIKPENIIINNDGILKLIDYDSAREYSHEKTNDTRFMGTNGYASPEQRGFNQSDARTDIYSMGILLNVMIVGKHPSQKYIIGRLKEVFDKCTKTIPDDRYQSINEFRNDLKKELYILESGNIPKNDFNYDRNLDELELNKRNTIYKKKEINRREFIENKKQDKNFEKYCEVSKLGKKDEDSTDKIDELSTIKEDLSFYKKDERKNEINNEDFSERINRIIKNKDERLKEKKISSSDIMVEKPSKEIKKYIKFKSVEECYGLKKGKLQQNIDDFCNDKKIEIKKRFQLLNNKVKKNLDKRKQKEEERRSNIKKNIILDNLLGFRTRCLWKLVLALFGYLFFIMCVSIGFREIHLRNCIADILLGFLPIIYGYFYTSKFKNKLPLFRSENILINILGYFVYFILIFIIFGIITDIINPVSPGTNV